MSDPLVQELRDAAMQLISAQTAWADILDLPTLHAAQERTIDVLTRAANALDAARQREQALIAALDEALDGWEYAAQYKGEYFIKKHGDAEDIARLRGTGGSRSGGPRPDK